MREYRINGNSLVRAPSILAQGKELYAQKGFVVSYELVYTMFPGITRDVVERILRGEIVTYDRGNTVIYFLEEEDQP